MKPLRIIGIDMCPWWVLATIQRQGEETRIHREVSHARGKWIVAAETGRSLAKKIPGVSSTAVAQLRALPYSCLNQLAEYVGIENASAIGTDSSRLLIEALVRRVMGVSEEKCSRCNRFAGSHAVWCRS